MKKIRKIMRSYTIEEKFSLIKKYIASGCSQKSFCNRNGIHLSTFNSWLHTYDVPNIERIEQIMEANGIPTKEEELQSELAKLRTEKQALEKALANERMKVEVCETLIDLAESTYHIKIRKNSAAK